MIVVTILITILIVIFFIIISTIISAITIINFIIFISSMVIIELPNGVGSVGVGGDELLGTALKV